MLSSIGAAAGPAIASAGGSQSGIMDVLRQYLGDSDFTNAAQDLGQYLSPERQPMQFAPMQQFGPMPLQPIPRLSPPRLKPPLGLLAQPFNEGMR